MLDLRLGEIGTTPVLTLSGSMESKDTPVLSARLQSLIASGKVVFVIDMSGASKLLPEGGELIVKAARKIRGQDGNAIIVGPGSETEVDAILGVHGAAREFMMYSTMDQALTTADALRKKRLGKSISVGKLKNAQVAAAEPEPGQAGAGQLTCPSCRAVVPADADRCYLCGMLLSDRETMLFHTPEFEKCAHCGANMLKTSSNCPLCGKKRSGAETPGESKPPAVEKRPKDSLLASLSAKKPGSPAPVAPAPAPAQSAPGPAAPAAQSLEPDPVSAPLQPASKTEESQLLQRDALLDELTNLQIKRGDLKAEIKKLTEEQAAFAERLAERERVLVEREKAADDLRQIINTLRLQKVESEKKIKLLEEHVEVAVKRADDAYEQARVAQNTVVERQNRAGGVWAEVAAAEDRHDVLKEMIQIYEGKVEDLLKSEVAQLEKEKEVIAGELANLKKELVASQAQVWESSEKVREQGALAAAVLDAQKESEERQREVEALELRREGLTADIEVLEKELTASRAEAEKLRVERSDLRVLIDEDHELNAELNKKRELLDRELAAASKEVEKLTAEQTRLTSEVVAAQRALDQFTSKKISVENEIEKRNAIAARLEGEIDSHKNQSATLTEEIAGLRETSEALRAELIEMRGELQAGRRDLDGAAREREAKSHAREGIEEELADLAARKAEIESEVEQLSAKRESIASELTDLGSRKSALANGITRAAEERESLRSVLKEFENRRAAAEGALSDAENQREEIANEIVALERRRDEASSAAAHEEEKLAGIRGGIDEDLARQQGEAGDLRKSIDELSREKKRLENDRRNCVDDLEKVVEETQKKREAVEKTVAELESRRTSLNEELDALAREVRSRRADAETAVREIEGRADELESSIARRRNESEELLKTLEGNVAVIENRRRELEKEFTNRESSFAAAENERRKSLAELESNLATAKNELTELLRSKEDALRDLERTREEAESISAPVIFHEEPEGIPRQGLRDEIAALQSEKDSISRDIEFEKKTREIMKAEVERWMRDRKKIGGDAESDLVAALRSEIDMLRRLAPAAGADKGEISEPIGASQAPEPADRSDEFSREISELREELAKTTAELEGLAVQSETSRDELESVKAERNEQASAIEDLRREMAELRRDRDALEEAERRVRAMADEAENEREELARRLKETIEKQRAEAVEREKPVEAPPKQPAFDVTVFETERAELEKKVRVLTAMLAEQDVVKNELRRELREKIARCEEAEAAMGRLAAADEDREPSQAEPGPHATEREVESSVFDGISLERDDVASEDDEIRLAAEPFESDEIDFDDDAAQVDVAEEPQEAPVIHVSESVPSIVPIKIDRPWREWENVEQIIDEGVRLEDNGLRLEAYAAYERALEMEPENERALHNRALLYFQDRNLEAARADLERLAATGKGLRQESRRLLDKVKMKQGDKQTVSSWLEKIAGWIDGH